MEYNTTNKEEKVRNKREAVVLHTAGNKRKTKWITKSISTANPVLASKINRKEKEDDGKIHNEP